VVYEKSWSFGVPIEKVILGGDHILPLFDQNFVPDNLDGFNTLI